MNNLAKKGLLSLGLLVVGVGLIVFGLSSLEPEPLKMPEHLKGVIVESPAMKLPEFSLLDHNGNSFTNNDLKGRWTIAFFGYTNCPDFCPTSLGVMEKVSQKFQFPEDTLFIFGTVDPKRDTPAVLKEFLSFFSEKFIGLTGEKAQIDILADSLGVIYDYEGDVESDDYIVNHFGAVYLFDPKGRLRTHILAPHEVERLGEALMLSINYYD